MYKIIYFIVYTKVQIIFNKYYWTSQGKIISFAYGFIILMDNNSLEIDMDESKYKHFGKETLHF